MKRHLISDEWAREVHGTVTMGFKNGLYPTALTFCGVLEDGYNSIARKWILAETKRRYDNDYNNVILPHIINHNNKRISEYTIRDCEEVLNSIKRDGYISQGKRQNYSESQMNHYKHLIYSVFRYAILVGYCQNFLWGTKFEITQDREELAIRSKTCIKKSLSIEQEKRLVAQVLETPTEDGRSIALLLMYSLGLRDGEACGLDYGDIYELPYYKGYYVAIIRQTTIPKSCIVQSGGKTWNSGRRIPIPDKVAKFLLQRKAIVEDIISANNLGIDVNKLPVACDGYLNNLSNIGKRLKADYVTDEARKVFRQVGISSEVLGTLEIEMEENSAKLEVSERNVTAYLLRRNFATHLKILGLDYPDIQYLLGHCIEDPYINRPDYTDSKLYALSKKMAKRPLVNNPIEKCMRIGCNTECYVSGKATLEIECESEIVKVQIHAMEKDDVLKIQNVNHNNNIKISSFECYKAYEPHRTLDILDKYTSDYE